MRGLFLKFNWRTLWIALALLPGSMLLAITYNSAATPEDERGGIPTYQVDPSWPKQLPHDWIIGQVGGLTVDQHDHNLCWPRPHRHREEDAVLLVTGSPHMTRTCQTASS